MLALKLNFMQLGPGVRFQDVHSIHIPVEYVPFVVSNATLSFGPGICCKLQNFLSVVSVVLLKMFPWHPVYAFSCLICANNRYLYHTHTGPMET